MGFISEFKDFAIKGNLIDMAVGIIMGAAFTKVIDTLVGGVMMPPIGKITGGIDFNNMAIDIGKEGTPVLIKYGSLITEIIKFTIVAFAVFLLVKGVNNLRKTLEKEKAAAPPPPPTADQKLLTEIRDLLARR